MGSGYKGRSCGGGYVGVGMWNKIMQGHVVELVMRAHIKHQGHTSS